MSLSKKSACEGLAMQLLSLFPMNPYGGSEDPGGGLVASSQAPLTPS